MKTVLFSVLATTSILVGCANPINRVTSDNYSETCAVAESNGRLKVAEEACYRALVNVDLGNLGAELKSERLYNLARIKRQLAKFAEAEQLLKESLAIEEKLPSPSEPKIGRRLVELSVSLAAQDKWAEGAKLLERALPITPQFAGQERRYTIEVLTQYSKQLKTMNQVDVAQQFETKAAALK
jgi:tetratricopeptide (TPR) repeat protein